ncbi:MAG: hypothetical protein ACXW61_17785, partial [Gemmatirosa sp.]
MPGGSEVADFHALGAARAIAARLSVPLVHRRCEHVDAGPRTIARATCARVAPSADVVRDRDALVGGVNRTLRARSSPSALHAAALLELTTPGASTRAVDRAIGYLRSARAVAGPSEALLVDLSAALLARAERAQRV